MGPAIYRRVLSKLRLNSPWGSAPQDSGNFFLYYIALEARAGGGEGLRCARVKNIDHHEKSFGADTLLLVWTQQAWIIFATNRDPSLSSPTPSSRNINQSAGTRTTSTACFMYSYVWWISLWRVWYTPLLWENKSTSLLVHTSTKQISSAPPASQGIVLWTNVVPFSRTVRSFHKKVCKRKKDVGTAFKKETYVEKTTFFLRDASACVNFTATVF